MSQSAIELQFFGDVSLNGLFCDPQYTSVLSSSLREFSKLIGKADYRVVNWEAPITMRGEFNPFKNPVICTSELCSKSFIDAFDFDAVCLGNNHIGDCLEEGYITTVDFFQKNKVDIFGVNRTNTNQQVPLKVKIGDISIGMLSYVGKETNPNIQSDSGIVINYLEPKVVLQEIEYWSLLMDVLIVHLHWGIEYNQYPSIEQRRLAQSFIDAGASVIIGHHSHSLQGIEEYGGGIIAYSLGNFVFSGLKGKESFGWPSFCRNSVCLKIRIEKTGVLGYVTVPFYTDNYGVDTSKGEPKLMDELSKSFGYSLQVYKLVRTLNLMTVWTWKLPIFLVRTKGGIFSAIKSYFNVSYLKLVYGYLFKSP